MELSISKMQTSKVEFLMQDLNLGYTKQQIIQSACDCQLCINDVKPISRPQSPRQVSVNQVNVPSSQNFLYLLKKLTNYRGIISIPEIIFLQQGMLFYSNEWGKLRMRDKVSNQQAKKFFDDRRQKARMTNRSLQREKDSYVLVYKSGTQQLMTQANYNKILAKRKNDPFWTEVIYSYKLPESKQTQPQLKSYCYKRTKSVSQRMIKIMEKVMNQVDNNEQKLNKDYQLLKNNSMISVDPNLQNNSIMIKSLVSKNAQLNISQQLNQFQMMASENNINESQYMSAIFKVQKSKIRGLVPSMKHIVQQFVAYLQVTSKTRILQLDLDYAQVDFQPTIIGIRKLIVCDVPPQQQCYLHDRYKPIEHIGMQQLVQFKKIVDRKDQQVLWSVCTDILQSCLEQRRIRLKISDYRKPSKADLKEIFMKFFPDFAPYLMFQNINWKNQLPKFMEQTGKKLKNIIESDIGISVLKRFNIIFYRTF